MATLVTALSLFGVSFATWSTIVEVPFTGVVSVAGFGGGLALVIAAAVVRTDRLHRIDVGLLVLGLLLLAGWAVSNIYLQPAYGTDEAAFEQYSASLLLHGHNPYGANLTSALTEFRVPIQYATYLLGGGIVHTLGYPAVPVYVAALFIPLTGGVQSVIVADVVALGATCLLAYLLLPRIWKSLAVLLTIGLPILFGYSVSGVNAILMGLPLLVVAWRWTETGRQGRLSRADIVRAVCLGLAVSTQQLAWFIAPFVIVGIWRLRRDQTTRKDARRVTSTFVAWAAGSFLVLNLPFIVWNAGAWFSGVTSTLTQHAIPYGQGLVDAALFFHVGGGGLAYYTLAALFLYVGLLLCYIARFDRLGRACFVLPVTALYFSTRSLAEYFMALIAVWAMSLLTTNPEEFRDVPPWWCLHRPRWKLGATFAPAVAATVLALFLPAPLQLSILSVKTNGELEGVWQFEVAATNTSGHPLSPQFEANFVGQATTFFHRISGPAVLEPGQRALYTLVAPNRGSMPGITTPFAVLATTARPETISVSKNYTPQPYSADLEPGYVNTILTTGRQTSFQVLLRSPFGAQVHRAGVRVALGQIIYGQQNLIAAQAAINGRPEGQTPVYAYTNSDGVASFTVTDPQPQDQPIYFQAWVAGAYPYGYSMIVPVLWRSSGRG